MRVALKSSWLPGEAGGYPYPSARGDRGGLGAQDVVEIPTFHCIEWETDKLALLRAAGSLMVRLYARAWRCWGLGRDRHLLGLHVQVRIPALEDTGQFPVQRPHPRL